MNVFQKSLYDDLMALCSGEDATFYYVDHISNNITYRVFCYRIASYTDFMKPNALNCRGTMFKLNYAGEMDSLVALPPKKFFNWKENPTTMNLDLTKVAYVMDKMDGSLMTTYLMDSQAILKSKTSLTSEQAKAANIYLDHADRFALRGFLFSMLMRGYSVSLEFTAPENRIVVGYQEEKLTILEARNMLTGDELAYSDLYAMAQLFSCNGYMVTNHKIDNTEDFINSIADITDNIEGFVVVMEDGQKMKIKTDYYKNLHSIKMNLDSDSNIISLVVNENDDDVIASFPDDQYLRDKINFFKDKLKKIFVLLSVVEDYCIRYSYMDRKAFAIKSKAILAGPLFGFAMTKYQNKEFNLKQFLLRKFEDLDLLVQSLQDIQTVLA